MQQGTDFVLKAKIAETSPNLLLSGSPRDWPKGCNKQDTPYSSFRTFDAQDLPRAHDAVAAVRLSDDFIQRYEKMRRLWSSIFRAVDTTQRSAAEALILDVLEVRLGLLPAVT